MLVELERHPNARAVLAPALAGTARPSHAYLFHGPGGVGKRAVARAVAAAWLSAGSVDPVSARTRALHGSHPDLTWVTPSGAHELLVSDIDGPVVSAASRTPFESARRVFVIESVDQMGDEAANRMLKTLEEPPSFVHLILITERLGEVLPTIRSRCQLVRFEAPSVDEIAADLEREGVAPQPAAACARLSLGDARTGSGAVRARGHRAAGGRRGVHPRRARRDRLVLGTVDGDPQGGPRSRRAAQQRARGAAAMPSWSCCPGRSASVPRRSGATGSAAGAGAPRRPRSTSRWSSSASG